jgi:hypothetical protein
MTSELILKVYNKENKLNLLIRDTDITKTVSIYKYNGEIVDTHSFTYAKGGELKFWQAYYELSTEVGDDLKETVTITKNMMEHFSINDDKEIITTTTNLDSRNVYEKRKKYYNGELYESEFLNDKLNDLKFYIQEKKIKEYLKTIQDGE